MKNIVTIPQQAEKTGFLTFLCTLNFIVAIIGYPITMALLSPIAVDILSGATENSYLITWPYRAFAAILGTATLFATHSRQMPKFDLRMGLFVFFWILYLLRAIYDLEIRTDFTSRITILSNYRLQAWNTIIFGTLIPLLGTLKSIDLIDFQRIAKWIFYVGGLALIASLFSIAKIAEASWTGEIKGRADAAATLNTIAFGHLGLSVATLAFYKFSDKKSKILERILGICLMCVGAYVILRAGSRGPILCAFVMALFYTLSRTRFAAVGLFFAALFSFVVYLFFPQIINFIRLISPVMANRIELTVYEGDTSGRDTLLATYGKEILENPILGGHLDILGYAHNSCVDGFLMFGILFGWIIFALVLIGYRSYYKILKQRKGGSWIALLGIQGITACQTSGTFGGNGFVQCLWIIAVVWTSNWFILRARKMSIAPYFPRR